MPKRGKQHIYKFGAAKKEIKKFQKEYGKEHGKYVYGAVVGNLTRQRRARR